VRSEYHWCAILERSLSGLFLGALVGAFFASVTGTTIGTIAGAVNPSLRGTASAQVMIASAILAIPGSAIGGVCGAVWKRRRIGSISGLAGSLFAVSYPNFLLCRYDDCSLPESLILFGVLPMLASLLAGAMLASISNQIIHHWERNE
jgi:hypothetical protein